MKKYILAISFSSSIFIASAVMVHAATENVSFDASAGNLSVSGTCSQRFVLVIIRQTSDNSIWGSSNPDCVNGSYSYEVVVPESDRGASIFNVQVFDESSAGGSIPATSTTLGGVVQPIIFTAPVMTTAISTATIVVDTSSLAVAPYDPSILDAVISQFFGIVADTTDAIQSFTTVVANSVKASLAVVADLFTQNATILPGGSLNVPSGANQLTGDAWLNPGATDVFVPNTAVTSSSNVIVTPTTPTAVPLAVTDKEDGVGFHVSTPSPQQTPISFDWFIVQTYDAGLPTMTQSSGNTTQNAAAPSVSDATSNVISTSDMDAATTTDTATTTTIDISTDTSVASAIEIATSSFDPTIPVIIDATTSVDQATTTSS